MEQQLMGEFVEFQKKSNFLYFKYLLIIYDLGGFKFLKSVQIGGRANGTLPSICEEYGGFKGAN
jgi:hypothetical protein